jgi:hypothetical protein
VFVYRISTILSPRQPSSCATVSFFLSSYVRAIRLTSCFVYTVIAKQFPTTSAKSTLENETERARWEALYVHVYAMVRRWKQLPTIAQVAERTREEKRAAMGQDKPPSNLPEDSNVDEGAATLDRIERGLKETSRLVGDHLVWETIGDRASERAVEFLLDKR